LDLADRFGTDNEGLRRVDTTLMPTYVRGDKKEADAAE